MDIEIRNPFVPPMPRRPAARPFAEARRDRRMAMLGIALALAFSLACWAALAIVLSRLF